jgi:hypothetical protein
MSLLFSNWLNEGYYEDDGRGDLTRIKDPADILRIQKEGNLYHNDGFTTDKVDENEIISLNNENN